MSESLPNLSQNTDTDERKGDYKGRKRNIDLQIKMEAKDDHEAMKEGLLLLLLLQGWTQCCFFLPVKKRLCNLGRAPGSRYCGNHRPSHEAPSERVRRLAMASSSSEGNRSGAERIPCPVDPSHTIYLHNLAAHVQICNVSKDLKRLEQQSYYCKDCNSGSSHLWNNNSPPSEGSDRNKEVCAKTLAAKIRDCFEDHVKAELEEPEVWKEEEGQENKVQEEEEGQDNEEKEGAGRGVYKEIMAQLGAEQTSFQRLRHIKQDADIISQMATFQLFSRDCRHVFIELGAGKGKLGVSLRVVAPLSRVVFVERSGQRRKADRVNADHAQSFLRIRMDIRHCLVHRLPLPTIPAAPPSTVNEERKECLPSSVIVAKHLCGLATDLALRSASNFLSSSSSSPTTHFAGVSIATCCHHACSSEDYVGTPWLVERGFTAAEFELMRYWSGWVNSFREAEDDDSSKVDKEETEEHRAITSSRVARVAGLSGEELRQLGFMTRRVIDQGRVNFLRALGLRAVQRRYCSPSLSPECYLILASASQEVSTPTEN